MQPVRSPFPQRLTPTGGLGVLIGGLVAFHLWLAVLLPLGVDEAHYALYGWWPDWSYFDHPPLIGWIEALSVRLHDSDWGARLLPILLGAGAILLLWRLSRTLFPEWPAVARWTLFLLLFSPLLHLMTLTPLPDLPLLLIGAALAQYLWRQRHHARLHRPWVLGLLMGLAGLSKYTAITFVFSFLAVVLVYRRWQWLRQPGLWGAVLLALVLLMPVLYWNARHDWISFLYQLQHGTHHPDWSFERFLIGLGRQAGAYGPVLFLAGWGMLLWGLGRWRSLPEPVRFLMLFVIPVWGLFAWSSGHEPILPHWTATGWWLVLPAVAWWLARRPWALWLHGMLGAAVWGLLLHTVLTGQWPFRGPHPLLEVAGWQTAAGQLAGMTDRLGTSSGEPVYRFAGNWSLVSRPVWYLRHRDDAAVFPADGRTTQFDFWFERPPPGARGVVLWHTYFDDHRDPAARGLFQHCRLLAQWPVVWHGQAPRAKPVRLDADFRLYDCEGWQRARQN